LSKNKEKISLLVNYPLNRQYPIPPIKNKNEFIKRFEEVFDNNLITMISNSKVKKDWSQVGWRGIMLLNGEIWLDYDGKLIATNYQSASEQSKQKKIINLDRTILNSSLRDFLSPICVLETSKYRIRIDEMKDGGYRYASWKIQQSMAEKPEMIVLNGKVEFHGSGGNHTYIFNSEDYSYECDIVELGEDENSPPAVLRVKKGEKILLNQNAKIK